MKARPEVPLGTEGGEGEHVACRPSAVRVARRGPAAGMRRERRHSTAYPRCIEAEGGSRGGRPRAGEAARGGLRACAPASRKRPAEGPFTGSGFSRFGSRVRESRPAVGGAPDEVGRGRAHGEAPAFPEAPQGRALRPSASVMCTNKCFEKEMCRNTCIFVEKNFIFAALV